MYHTTVDTEKKHIRMRQDVYEHLAKVFLDKKKKKKPDKKILFITAVLSIGCLLLLSITAVFLTKRKFFARSLYVLNSNTPTLIEYDFRSLGSAKTKAISFNLGNIDLSKYRFLDLSIRSQENAKVNSTIKVQIENFLLEKDTQYISGINAKWKKVSLGLDNFRLIKDWSQVKSLTFTVEDWNVSSKKNTIIIDDIRFIE